MNSVNVKFQEFKLSVIEQESQILAWQNKTQGPGQKKIIIPKLNFFSFIVVSLK